jgi:hypothetical protein
MADVCLHPRPVVDLLEKSGIMKLSFLALSF